MSPALRLCLYAAAMAAIACASPASAQTTSQPKAKQEEGVQAPLMRPAQQPERPAPPPPVLLTPLPPSDIPDSAPRIGGLSEQPRGGAQCRTGCARRYYRCLSQDDMASCSPAWSRCLIACPRVSSSE